MALLLIDDGGIEWPGASRKLREAFGSPFSGSEFVDYAIANLGFVAIDDYGASCQLRLRPSLINEACWRGVSRWLRRSRSERVVVSALGTEWTYELIRSADVAIRRVETMIEQAERARLDDFLSRPLRLDELQSASPLAQIVRNWANLSVPSGQERLRALVKATLGERYIIVKRNDSNSKVVFHEVGDGLFARYETWRNCAVGAPMQEMPDRSYGRWASQCYDVALETNLPQIEEVDALVHWPHAGRSRLRYRRVIVPLRDATDAPMLLGGSLIDSRIDLRFRTG